ncbi:GAF domain-containing sensor histidine kinase [Acanthopleuribacter pedis]|uniref:histidine kinase n=1 Tax=Acanthopleuribacter pedis TaxID=442870 RepID=A0A8J7Q9I9_9BACT|nr:ATP-binding protein [Acanthopleuribacter pedis]MBO1319914.1 GAF domain-containing protein [Acanthopleuribacter pedis]
MKLDLRESRQFADHEQRVAFLAADAFHFLWGDDYPEPDLPEPMRPRFIKRGSNQRPGYQHLPQGAGEEELLLFCRLMRQESFGKTKPSLETPGAEEPQLLQLLALFSGALGSEVCFETIAGELLRHACNLFNAVGAVVLTLNEDGGGLRFAASYSVDPHVSRKISNLEIPTGVGITGWVIDHKQSFLCHDVTSEPLFRPGVSKELAYEINALMATPILAGDHVMGVLQFVSTQIHCFDETQIPILEMVAAIVSVFLERANLDSERKDMARVTGTAEVANSVLHNIGNILNSLMVSCSLVDSRLRQSKMPQLIRAHEVFEEHINDLADFFTNNPKGEILPRFLLKVGNQLAKDHDMLSNEIRKINEKATLMRDIIETQQTISKIGGSEIQAVVQVIDEAISLQSNFLERHKILIKRDFRTDKPVRASKAKLIHILVNLIKNAAEAMSHLPPEARALAVSLEENDEGEVLVHVRDEGIGIEPDHLAKMFTHGFTTKESGHGFGLHFCANAMEEMRGRISVHSDGPHCGTTFTLVFPPVPKRV